MSVHKPTSSPDTTDVPPASSDDIMDMTTFYQVLDLDDDGYDFSAAMAEAYFAQARTTFEDMDQALYDIFCLLLFIPIIVRIEVQRT